MYAPGPLRLRKNFLIGSQRDFCYNHLRDQSRERFGTNTRPGDIPWSAGALRQGRVSLGGGNRTPRHTRGRHVRAEGSDSKPRNAEGCWLLPQAGRGAWGRSSSRTRSGSPPCGRLDLGPPASGTGREHISVVFMLPPLRGNFTMAAPAHDHTASSATRNPCGESRCDFTVRGGTRSHGSPAC